MSESIVIELVTADPRSIATKDQLERLLTQYDLSRWLHTYAVAIDAMAIPHSHPVLTLHTRHLDDDRLLLSTFLHEQMHWFLTSRPDVAVQGAYDDLRALFPEAPHDMPDGGGSEWSTYLHLVVNLLEYEALTAVIGAAEAREAFEFWSNDHYRWIYRTVLERGHDIRRIMEKHELTDRG